MNFDITPEEAQPSAGRLFAHLRALKQKVSVERPAWDDAPYRTTLFTKLGSEIVLYEVQGTLAFHTRLKEFATWIAANRRCAELFLVGESGSVTTVGLFSQLKRCGVGLMLLNDQNQFELSLPARNPAYVVTPDPSLRFGSITAEVSSCITKFNDGQRKDGLRDLCEVVERETERALILAVQKRWSTLTEMHVRQKDWSDQINALASQNIMQGGHPALIDSKLKDDLQSFRGARNLVDHKVRSKREDGRRRRQFLERMMMGTRLISELVALCRRIR